MALSLPPLCFRGRFLQTLDIPCQFIETILRDRFRASLSCRPARK
jgi:hypothetical protein